MKNQMNFVYKTNENYAIECNDKLQLLSYCVKLIRMRVINSQK